MHHTYNVLRLNSQSLSIHASLNSKLNDPLFIVGPPFDALVRLRSSSSSHPVGFQDQSSDRNPKDAQELTTYVRDLDVSEQL
jgi:hypothetical protein